jgi:hypothetical protein
MNVYVHMYMNNIHLTILQLVSKTHENFPAPPGRIEQKQIAASGDLQGFTIDNRLL